MSIFSTLNIKDSIRIKTFELHDHTFKVKIPLAGELDAINNRIIDVPKADIDARFGELSAKLLADGQIEGVEKTKNDLIIDECLCARFRKLVCAWNAKLSNTSSCLFPRMAHWKK
jgi:hypothetical protein